MRTTPDPTSTRGCLLHAGGPLLALWGGSWIGAGVYRLAAPSPDVPRWVGGGFLCAGIVLFAIGVRLLVRVARPSPRPASGRTGGTGVSIDDVALGDGRTATVRVRERQLELETQEIRAWSAGLAALGLGAYVSHAVGTVGGGPPSGTALWIGLAFGAVSHLFRRRRVRSYPLDAFASVVTDDRVVTLHRRGGGRRPLALAAKSWHVERLVAALRERVPEASAETPEERSWEPPDDFAELRRVVASWLPTGRDATSTILGVVFVAFALLLGAFEEAGPLDRSFLRPPWFAIGALLVWLQDAATQRLRQRARERVHGRSERPLVVHIRRSRGDVLAWLAPWQRTVLLRGRGRLVLEHRHVDPVEAGIVLGTACLGGWLVLGGLTPLHAGAFLLLLLASGFPRRHGVPEVLEPQDVLALHDAGSRATLTVRGEEGTREIVMRVEGGQGRRVAALVRSLCPEAEIREPGWRRHPDTVINQAD